MVAQGDSLAGNILEVADAPRLSKETKAFLNVLNSGGVPLETLPPLEARQVLYASPLQATVEQLQGLPPSLIQTPVR